MNKLQLPKKSINEFRSTMGNRKLTYRRGCCVKVLKKMKGVSMCIPGGRTFQEEETASLKMLKCFWSGIFEEKHGAQET